MRKDSDDVSTDILSAQLSKVPYFHDMPLPMVRDLVTRGVLLRPPAGAVIFAEDKPAEGLFVLIKGRVQICRLGLNGQLSIIDIIEPVKMFNEVTAIDGGLNPVTAVCLDDCILWRLSPHELEQVILQYPRVGLGMLHVLVRRNRELVSKFHDLSFSTVLDRAAKLLLDLSQQGSLPIDRRRHPNFQMAAQISTVPEAFSRCIKILRQRGLIETNQRHITILDAEAINAMISAQNVI